MGELVTESLYNLPHIQEENLNVPSLINPIRRYCTHK